MSEKINKELKDLIQMIERFPNGISIEELSNLLTVTMSRRTLQYRLSNLVRAGILKVVGSGRSSKYVIKENSDQTLEPVETIQKTSIIPLSQEGKKVQSMISVPIQLRHHVSYRREFLDSYVPNKTFYLTKNMLEKLKMLGPSGNNNGRPAGTYARKIYQRLLIDLSWNSSRLEGNTYSLLETEKLLETGEEAAGKDHLEAQMILNHKDAIEFIVDMAEEIDINRYTILNIHGLLSNQLLADPKACGRLRTMPVKIGKSVYHPIEVPNLIEEQFQQIIQKAAAIKNPFEQSFFLMVHLPYLQPFLDVNKRVSRLAGNIPFIRDNLSPLSFVDVPETDYVQGLLAIYELNKIELFRDVFMWAYERSASLYVATLEAIGQPDPFKVRYRELLRQVVFEVIQHKLNKMEASQHISKFAKHKIPDDDRHRFVEIAEIEVMSLHEGNFARFKVKPSKFFEWQKGWE
jgi:Fic family protein